MSPSVTVVGAGVVGLACASQLQMRGHAVTLIDPREPGEYCSFGNAGCLSRASCVPLGLPGLWKKIPGWLMDPEGPLFISPRYGRKIAPWLWQFQRASTMSRVNRIADALHALLTTTIDKWRPLAAWAGVRELILQQGYGFAYASEAAFEADALGREIRAARGVKMEVMRGADIIAFEPALSPDLTHFVLLPEQGHCPNPLRLSRALAARLVNGGAKFVRGSVTGFEIIDRRVGRVLTDGEPVSDVDQIVIAAGAHSATLSSLLGAHVPLETERGYHAMVKRPSVVPRIPIASGDDKYFVTPMEEGLRIAGTVELAGLAAPPNYARAETLLHKAQRLLPGLTGEEVTKWMGHRPSLPDSLPVIGRAPRASNAWFAFGHGHVGLTAAAPTSEIIADLIAGRTPFVDVTPFRAERFRNLQ